jgi:hypothetical protein
MKRFSSGQRYTTSASGFHPQMRRQVYPIDQRAGLQNERIETVKEEKQFNNRSLT